MMAMVVHGYGLAAEPGPGVYYSALVYAKLLQALGTLGGLQAYGVVTYVLLAAACAATAWALWRAGATPALAAIGLLTVFAPAALYPQFTVLAGLLTMAGLLVLVIGKGMPGAAAGAVLILLGGLVRAAEVVAVLVFTAPFWLPALRSAPWPKRSQAVCALAGALLLLAGSTAIDRAYYSAEPWRQHVAIDGARVALTDYGIGRYFRLYPAEAARLGFLPNDLSMMEGWFFADPRVFTAARVNRLAAAAPLDGRARVNVGRWRELLAPFFDPGFGAALLLAVLAAWQARSRAAAWALGALAAAMVVLMLAGRPGTTRIYLPPLAGILLFTLATQPVRMTRLAWSAAGAGLAFIAALLAWRNAMDIDESQRMRAALCRLPPERLYVVWAERLPYEFVYRPLAPPGDGCALNIYPLSPQSYAPYALERLRAATGEPDVVSALLTGKEMDFLADAGEIGLLQRHLQVHYGRALSWELLAGDGRRGSWYRVQVAPKS